MYALKLDVLQQEHARYQRNEDPRTNSGRHDDEDEKDQGDAETRWPTMLGDVGDEGIGYAAGTHRRPEDPSCSDLGGSLAPKLSCGRFNDCERSEHL